MNRDIGSRIVAYIKILFRDILIAGVMLALCSVITGANSVDFAISLFIPFSAFLIIAIPAFNGNKAAPEAFWAAVVILATHLIYAGATPSKLKYLFLYAFTGLLGFLFGYAVRHLAGKHQEKRDGD